jgi:glycerol-1-phosphate dehydrogenase [NAD(P)+]
MKFNEEILIGNKIGVELIENLREGDLFIYSPTSISQLKNIRIGAGAECISRKELKLDKNKIEDFSQNKKFRRIVSFGNGQTADTAKFISKTLRIEHVYLPAMFSTNAAFTDKSCLFSAGKKLTFDSSPPNKVIIDFDILKKCDFKYNLMGMAEIISIFTALEDWKIADKRKVEKIDRVIFESARNLTSLLENNLDLILKKDKSSLKFIFQLLIQSAYLTNIYGSGRAESGSEHIFAKHLEGETTVFHGTAVAFGSLIFSIIQGKNYKKIFALIKKLEILKRKDLGISKNDLIRILSTLKSRPDRYSVIDSKQITKAYSKIIINRIFNDLGWK